MPFYRFPSKDTELTEKWENAIGRQNEYWKAKRYSRVCSKHFLASDFARPLSNRVKRQRLKKTAVPSCFEVNQQTMDPTKACNWKRSAPDDNTVSPRKVTDEVA